MTDLYVGKDSSGFYLGHECGAIRGFESEEEVLQEIQTIQSPLPQKIELFREEEITPCPYEDSVVHASIRRGMGYCIPSKCKVDGMEVSLKWEPSQWDGLAARIHPKVVVSYKSDKSVKVSFVSVLGQWEWADPTYKYFGHYTGWSKISIVIPHGASSWEEMICKISI